MPAEQISPADDFRKKQGAAAEEPEEAVDYGPELDAETILGADDRPVERHRAWNGHVWMWTLTGLELDQFDRYMARQVDQRTGELPLEAHWRAALLVKCLRDSAGKPLFSEEDIPALGQKSGPQLDALFDVARRMNKRKPGDIDELKKASGAGPRGSSPQDSAASSEAGATPKSA